METKLPEIKISFTIEDLKNRPQIKNAESAKSLIYPTFEDFIFHHEEIWGLLLNNSSKVLGVIQLGVGEVNASICNCKALYQSMILANAVGCILVHNHPSGNIKTSDADDNLTKKVAKALELLDMRLLDHIIITSDSYYSYTEEGRL